MIAYKQRGSILFPLDQYDFVGGDSWEVTKDFREFNIRENGATHFLLKTTLVNPDGSPFSDVPVIREGTNLRDSRDWRRRISMMAVC